MNAHKTTDISGSVKRHECRAPERGLQPASTPESEKKYGEQYNL
jgi:hypothetical protein